MGFLQRRGHHLFDISKRPQPVIQEPVRLPRCGEVEVPMAWLCVFGLRGRKEAWPAPEG